MRRISIILCAMLLSIFSTQAAKLSIPTTLLANTESELPNVAAIETTNGKTYYYALKSKPTLKYIASELVIATNEGSLSLNKSDVKELNFIYMEEIPSGINDVKASGVITYENQILTVSGYKAQTAVSVFGTDGRLLINTVVKRDGTATANLSTLPNGIYIIQAGDDNLKITK